MSAFEAETATPSARSAPIQRYAWVILGVVYLASVAAPLIQNKVPPIMPVIMEAFQINLSQAGLLMSVFAVTGFLLALPAGILLQLWRFKVTGLVALGFMVVGSLIGVAAGTVAMLLFSRVVEGVGMGLIAVVAPAAIAGWFPRERQGTPMGVWATWVPVGTLLMYAFGPSLVAAGGWQSVWWFGAIFAVAAFVLYLLLMREPQQGDTAPDAAAQPNLREALSNRSIWLLGLTFGCFNAVFIGLATFYPTFLAEVRGYSLSEAALIASISTMVVLFSAPVAGILSDRIGSRRLVFSLPFLAIAVLFLLPFRVTGWQLYAFLIVLGLVIGAIPTATFAAAPEIMGKPELAGIGLAVVIMCQNLGMFVGPVLFGVLAQSFGWTTAGSAMIPVALAGFVFAWRVRVR
ncbi:MAG: MFS transporter [Anaerolineae bacterium]|nr:MFS transporter [Anaerolineae bacterium]